MNRRNYITNEVGLFKRNNNYRPAKCCMTCFSVLRTGNTWTCGKDKYAFETKPTAVCNQYS